MIATPTKLRDVLLIEPKVFGDNRGLFFESFNQRKFSELIGRDVNFVQDNHSSSVRNVLRGLHYQAQHPQAKLVRVAQGAVLDVVVDLRPDSPTYGEHVTAILSGDNRRMLWIPEGFAHGFVVRSNTADLLYKTTDYWYPEHERCLRYDDPILEIDWQLRAAPIMSAKDMRGDDFASFKKNSLQFANC